MTDSGQLANLYPFLYGKRQDPRAVDAALRDSLRLKAADHLAVAEDFFAANGQALVEAARTLAEVFRGNGKLLTMGNGGSSCDAAHVAVEFLHPVTAGRPALTAINLASDVAMLTAVGNDVGPDHVFVRQVIALGQPGDCLLGLSTSGNSDNLIRAFAKAKAMGLKTVGFAGMDGGAMAEAGLDHLLVVATDSIHRIQECHVAAYHILWDLVHTLLADERGGVAPAGPGAGEDPPA